MTKFSIGLAIVLALFFSNCDKLGCGPVVVHKGDNINTFEQTQPYYKLDSGVLALSEDSVYRWVLVTGYNPLKTPVTMYAHCIFYLDGGDYEVLNENIDVEIGPQQKREVKFQTNYNRKSNPDERFFRNCVVTFGF